MWDCLTDCASDWGEENVMIVWKNHHLSQLILGIDYFNKIVQAFKLLKSRWKKHLVLKLE